LTCSVFFTALIIVSVVSINIVICTTKGHSITISKSEPTDYTILHSFTVDPMCFCLNGDHQGPMQYTTHMYSLEILCVVVIHVGGNLGRNVYLVFW